MIKTRTSIPSADGVSDKNWYSDKEISLIKKDAFDRGFEHFTQVYLKEFNENILKVQEKAAAFFILAQSKCDIRFQQIRLKPKSPNSFELIFLMPEEDFLSEDRFKAIYECGLSFIESNIADDFSVLFSYMPFSKSIEINQNDLLLNGYIYTYDPFREHKP